VKLLQGWILDLYPNKQGMALWLRKQAEWWLNHVQGRKLFSGKHRYNKYRFPLLVGHPRAKHDSASKKRNVLAERRTFMSLNYAQADRLVTRPSDQTSSREIRPIRSVETLGTACY
jgi:hypothetical protein